MKSIFLSNLHHTYAQTDGSYDIPNSLDGDLLKRAKIEIENNEKQVAELVELLEDIKRKLEDGQYWSPEMLKDELAEAINKHKQGE